MNLINQEYDHELYGTDISEEGLKTAKKIYGLNNLYLIDTYKIDFPDNYFNAVISIGHDPFNTPDKKHLMNVMSKIISTIKKDGYFIIVVVTNFSEKYVDGKVWKSKYNHSRKALVDIVDECIEAMPRRDTR